MSVYVTTFVWVINPLTFTISLDRIRVLTARPQIRFTLTRCLRQRRHNQSRFNPLIELELTVQTTGATSDSLAVMALPVKYRKRLKSTNMQERLIQEIRRRERVVRIFPNEASALRLMGALLAEIHEEWQGR